MANHKSAIKRIRSNRAKQINNRYQAKTMRNALRDLRAMTDKKEIQSKLPSFVSMVDTLAKKNVIHKNKAANLKSGLMNRIKALS
jgi:small subunit ribosomal protein S20